MNNEEIKTAVRGKLFREAIRFKSQVRRGAGYDGDGRFNITALRDALSNGITPEEIGVSQVYIDSLEKKVIDLTLQCSPSRLTEIELEVKSRST
jgi:predicted RNase H-like nuclease (RuvC/YqgF family)